MVRVIATVTVKPGKHSEFMEVLNNNIPNVVAEDGCVEYVAVVDTDSGIGSQVKIADEVIIIEHWTSLDALKTHLDAPHMATFRDEVKDLIEGVSLRILQ